MRKRPCGLVFESLSEDFFMEIATYGLLIQRIRYYILVYVAH